MKAIIENIQHFSLHDGPGTRTTVFFKGCPLKCLWCSNPTTQTPRRELIYKKDNCLRCGKCIAACKQNALSMDTSQKLPMVRIDKNLCTACKECKEHCPADALQTIGDEYDTAALFNIIKKRHLILPKHKWRGNVFRRGNAYALPVCQRIDKTM